MPIKVPQHIIDNDLLMYGQCYIETDHLDNERRLDPTKIKKYIGNSYLFGTVFKEEETPNIKARLELRGMFEQLNRKQYGEMLGVDFSTNPSVNIMWEVLRQHGYMMVKPQAPSTVDDGTIAFKRYEPINKLELNKKMTDEQIDEFKKKWLKECAINPMFFMKAYSQVPLECTCRDDQKQRSLCPVCDKEKYDQQMKMSEELKKTKQQLSNKFDEWGETLKNNPWLREQIEQTVEEEERRMQHDIQVTKEMFKDKPEDIIDPETFLNQ